MNYSRVNYKGGILTKHLMEIFLSPDLSDREKQAGRDMVRMFFVFRNMMRSMESCCRKHDLGLSQYSLLHHVASDADTNPSGFAQLMQLSRPAVTKIIAGLEEQGLLIRGLAQADRREVRLELTPAGHAKLDEINPDLLSLHRNLLKKMAESDLEGFETTLKMMETYFREYQKEGENKTSC